MAWKSGFFNSVNGDRKYTADEISEVFEGLIGNGVFESVGDCLAVRPHDGMTIAVGTGRGWFNRRWVKNDTEPLYLELNASDVTLNRYAAICIRVDDTTAVRSADIYVKYSDLASNPDKPDMVRTDEVNEYCLAYIYIKAGATAITVRDITDTRMDARLCGWVTGLVEQVDTTTLWLQWEAEFHDWFNALVEYLDENTETKLVADMQALQNRVAKYALTIKTTDWANKLALCTADLVSESSDIVVNVLADSQDVYVDSGVCASELLAGYIRFKCDTVPTQDINIEVLVVNV